MRVFYDTEFIEDGRTVDLISIGMVAEDGRELYLVDEAIEEDPLYSRIRGHNWLMQNMIPHLPLSARHDGEPSISQPGHPNVYPRSLGHFHLDRTDNRIVTRRYIRNAVRNFLLDGDMTGLELWAWYGAYDHVALAQLFGSMIQLPDGVPMWTNDLQQEIARRGLTEDQLPQQEDGMHNALADARYLMRVHQHLLGVDRADLCGCELGEATPHGPDCDCERDTADSPY